MVEAMSKPGTLSVIRRYRPHSNLRGISADYYNLTDLQGAPLAGLLVLKDRRGRPVRAEIHMGVPAAHVLHEVAVQQAQGLIIDRYDSDKPIRLYPLRVQLDSDPLSVQPQGSGRATGVGAGPAWALPLVGGLLLLLITLAGGWFLNEWLTGSPAGNAAPVTLSVDSSTAVRISETNGLAPSRNAIPMTVGDRVQLRPDVKITMRTQAGADAGAIVVSLQDANHMTILNGPIWRRGNSDTIVWWYVRLDDGIEGWVPANTSELTILERLR